MTALRGNALIVEDEELIAMMLSDMLTEMGLQVCGIASTAAGAIELAEEHRPDVVLMDVQLAGKGDGVDAATKIYQRHRIPVVFVTGSTDQATIDRIREDHAAAVLFKPIEAAQLRSAIERSMVRRVGAGPL